MWFVDFLFSRFEVLELIINSEKQQVQIISKTVLLGVLFIELKAYISRAFLSMRKLIKRLICINDLFNV